MKKIISIAIFLTPLLVSAQDLSSFQVVANYTLINTAADAQGMQPDIELINSPFAGAGGVYCNGNYIGGAPDSSLVQTPPLEALYKPSFAVQVEFKIDSLDESTHPVLICGNSWRYLGFQTKYDSSWITEFNDFSFTMDNSVAETGKWYQLTMIYSGPDTTAYWYLDGNLIDKRIGSLTRPDGDGRISNTHGGEGLTFRGFLRNLRVYQSDGIFSAVGEAPELDALRVFPNPANDFISLTGVPSGQFRWTILDMNGHALKNGAVTGEEQIALGAWPAGQYFLRVTNAKTGAGQSRIFIKE
ncbi:MAG: LamG-like jellyroll fold domain-containing protein [Saprospiraceae bacterium]